MWNCNIFLSVRLYCNRSIKNSWENLSHFISLTSPLINMNPTNLYWGQIGNLVNCLLAQYLLITLTSTFFSYWQYFPLATTLYVPAVSKLIRANLSFFRKDDEPYLSPDWIIAKVPLKHPLTPMSDQDRILPYSIYTISRRQVMKIKKNID